MKKASRLLLILLIIAVILIAVLIGPPQILQHLKQGIIVGNATPTARYASTSITFPRHDGSTPTPGSGTSTTHSVFTPSFPTGMPHVLGTQIVDSAGHQIILRGAQLETSFNYIKSWQAGQMPANVMLTGATFNAMVREWNMNVLRLPISNWIYALNPALYMSQLDRAIQLANSAGLYVVLDLHDDAKSGSPYGDNAGLPKTESLAFWKIIAAHYKNNPMVMFDIFNEPKDTSWQQWLHGGGTVDGANVVGFQDLVDAIRSVGAQQIIIVEPGSAGGGSPANAGWVTIGNNTINDPNIMYSLHIYDSIMDTPQQQDARWGPILNHQPIFYGEWALLPNGYGTAGYDHCKNIPHSQADQIVTAFMQYMASRHANWTAFQFTPYHLIQDFTTYTPTTLDIPWVCGDPTSHAGMGTMVKDFLTS